MSTNMVISSKQKALRPETYNETRFGVKKQFTVIQQCVGEQLLVQSAKLATEISLITVKVHKATKFFL